MNKIAKDILFNPTHFTVADIKSLIQSGEVTSEDVAKILKSDVFKAFKTISVDNFELPSAGIYQSLEYSNAVVLWGVRDSGKSSLIESLLTIDGFKLLIPNINQTHARRYGKNNGNSKGRIRKVFETKAWQKLFVSTADAPIEVVHSVYKPHWYSRSYPISFVEVNITEKGTTEWKKDLDWNYLISFLHSNPGHTHLFCLDCNPDTDENLNDALLRQIRYFNYVINNLKVNKLIDEASAFYVVVMKTDLMNAPREYVDNAAQTLITSSFSEFWQLVRNICYEKNIYNVQPVTSSIGRFALKDMAKLDLGYANRLFYEQILPKCQSRKLRIERWLDFSVGWVKWVVIVASLGVITWWAKNSLETLSGMPEDKVIPFDYVKYFKEEVDKGIRKESYNTARDKYHSLSYDLSTERMIKKKDGNRLLSESIAKSCDSLLNVSFAPSLSAYIKDFFEVIDWASHKTECAHIKWDAKALLDSKYLTDSQREEFSEARRYLNDLDKVREYIKQSKACKSMYYISRIQADSSKWKVYPYTNDSILNRDLTNAVYNAFQSATYDCCMNTDSILTMYYRKISEIRRQRVSDYDRDYAIYNERIRLKYNSNWLVRRMEDIIERIPYPEMRDDLMRSKSRITSITNNPVRPQRALTEKIKQKLEEWF